MRRLSRISLTAVTLLAACKEPTEVCTVLSPCEPEIGPPASITLSSASLSFFSLGETQQLNATVLDAAASEIPDPSVTWASSAPSVASVDSTGLVTALNVGNAIITVTSGAASETADVSVEQAADQVSLSPGSLLLPGSGSQASLRASVRDPGGSLIVNPSLVWSSNDETVATVSNTGLVTGQSGGEATITVVATSAGRSATSEALAQVDRLGVATMSLPDATVNSPYSAALEAVAGDGAYTWAIAGGTLPTGLALAGGTGVISGTPSTTGVSAFTVQVTDGLEDTATADLSIEVVGGFPALEITTTSLPHATVGTPYSQSVAASGGDGTYAWSLDEGGLPPALSTLTIDPATGTLTFTPSTGGAYGFMARVASGDGQNAAAQLTLTIDDPTNDFPVASILAPRPYFHEAEEFPITLEGAATDTEDGTLSGAALAWSSDLDGPLGTGVTLTTSSLSVGIHEITLTAADSGGGTGVATTTLEVTSGSGDVVMVSPNEPARIIVRNSLGDVVPPDQLTYDITTWWFPVEDANSRFSIDSDGILTLAQPVQSDGESFRLTASLGATPVAMVVVLVHSDDRDWTVEESEHWRTVLPWEWRRRALDAMADFGAALDTGWEAQGAISGSAFFGHMVDPLVWPPWTIVLGNDFGMNGSAIGVTESGLFDVFGQPRFRSIFSILSFDNLYNNPLLRMCYFFCGGGPAPQANAYREAFELLSLRAIGLDASLASTTRGVAEEHATDGFDPRVGDHLALLDAWELESDPWTEDMVHPVVGSADRVLTAIAVTLAEEYGWPSTVDRMGLSLKSSDAVISSILNVASGTPLTGAQRTAFFAASMSAAVATDLGARFAADWRISVDEVLFDALYQQLLTTVSQPLP